MEKENWIRSRQFVKLGKGKRKWDWPHHKLDC